MISLLRKIGASTTSLGADSFFYSRPLGIPTRAGMRVNEEGSLTLPAVFRAVDTLSSHMATVPKPIYRRKANGEREPAPEHPASRIVNLEPNQDQTAVAFWKAYILHTILWGTGRAEIVRSGRGLPMEMHLLPPDRVRTKRDENDRIVHLIGSETKLMDADCLRVTNLSYDGIVGYGLINHLARENVGLGLAISAYAQSFFGNGTTIGTVFSTDAELSQKVYDQTVDEIIKAHQGPGKAWKPLLMHKGVKPNNMSMTSEDAQLVETMTFNVQDVARWTNVPPPLLMELSRATFANITQLIRSYVKLSLVAGRFEFFEQERDRKLLSRREQQEFYFEWNPKGLLRGDDKERAEFYEIMTRNGFYTINRVMQLENEPGIGPVGDLHYINGGMTTAEAVAKATMSGRGLPGLPPADEGDSDDSDDDEPPPDEDVEDGGDEEAMRRQHRLAAAHRPVLVGAFSWLQQFDSNALRRAHGKASYNEWRDRFCGTYPGKVMKALEPAMDAMREAHQCVANTNGHFAETVHRATRKILERHVAEFIKATIADNPVEALTARGTPEQWADFAIKTFCGEIRNGN